MFNIDKVSSENQIELAFQGDIDVSQSGDIKNQLLSALDNYQIVKINLSKAESVDLSFFQLMCAAHQYSAKLGKDLHFTDSYPEHLKDMMNFSGFFRNSGCYKDEGKNCVWSKMTKEMDTAA